MCDVLYSMHCILHCTVCIVLHALHINSILHNAKYCILHWDNIYLATYSIQYSIYFAILYVASYTVCILYLCCMYMLFQCTVLYCKFYTVQYSTMYSTVHYTVQHSDMYCTVHVAVLQYMSLYGTVHITVLYNARHCAVHYCTVHITALYSKLLYYATFLQNLVFTVHNTVHDYRFSTRYNNSLFFFQSATTYAPGEGVWSNDTHIVHQEYGFLPVRNKTRINPQVLLAFLTTAMEGYSIVELGLLDGNSIRLDLNKFMSRSFQLNMNGNFQVFEVLRIMWKNFFLEVALLAGLLMRRYCTVCAVLYIFCIQSTVYAVQYIQVVLLQSIRI